MRSSVSYALALSAGMLAALNPCGFAMLPGFLSLILADIGGTRRAGPAALGRALGASAVMTAGFVAVFAAFAAVITPAAMWVQQYLPWATLGIGAGLTVLGLVMAGGREIRLPSRLAWPGRARTGAVGVAGIFVYGVSYACASLSCTVGPFLALTGAALRSGQLAGAAGVFAAYAVGMGLVVAVASVGVAVARDAVVATLRRGCRYVERAGGVVLSIAGAYLAYYGHAEIAQASANAGQDPIMAFASGLQAGVTEWLDGLGPAPVLVALLVLLGIGTGFPWARRRTGSARGAAKAATPAAGPREPPSAPRAR